MWILSDESIVMRLSTSLQLLLEKELMAFMWMHSINQNSHLRFPFSIFSYIFIVPVTTIRYSQSSSTIVPILKRSIPYVKYLVIGLRGRYQQGLTWKESIIEETVVIWEKYSHWVKIIIRNFCHCYWEFEERLHKNVFFVRGHLNLGSSDHNFARRDIELLYW